ncbi:MAG TPA: response regulator transcription factor [Solirubrobacteraceae bacterium]|nr:response regulator transcription factor [Solirubrobacteraceae bacterium]
MSSSAAEVHAGIEPQIGPLVLVVAADREIRARTVSALAPSGWRVRGAASALELMSGGLAPDLLVVHCELMNTGQLSELRDLKRERAELRLVIICDAGAGRSARRAVDGGADGIVFTEQLDSTLVPTVAAVLVGQTSVPTRLRASVKRPSLSFREKQILGMVVMGLTNGQIGSRLFLAESTVKSHLSSAFSKLGVRSRSEAAALILDPQESLGAGILAIMGPADRPQIAQAD